MTANHTEAHWDESEEVAKRFATTLYYYRVVSSTSTQVSSVSGRQTRPNYTTPTKLHDTRNDLVRHLLAIEAYFWR
jgi:hypothetical protein